jgi:CPA2 family monovalent cation:H+ antiporter-2
MHGGASPDGSLWAALPLTALKIVGFVALRHPRGTAFTVSAALAQIGEFSFILAGLGVGLGLLPDEGRNLILAGALISITLNPFLFRIVARLKTSGGRRQKPAGPVNESP